MCSKAPKPLPPSEIPQRHESGPPPLCAQRRRDVFVRVVGRDLDLVFRGQRDALLSSMSHGGLSLSRIAARRHRIRRGGVEIEIEAPDSVHAKAHSSVQATAAPAAARPRGHSG